VFSTSLRNNGKIWQPVRFLLRMKHSYWYSVYTVAVTNKSKLLATEEDILCLTRLYSEYFASQLPLGIPSLPDPGVEAGISPDQISVTLGLLPMSLHPHQLSGVHSAVRTGFVPQPHPWVSAGKIIAVEVGLRKTAITVATIGFVNHIVALLEAGKPLFPTLPLLSQAQAASQDTPRILIYQEFPSLGRLPRDVSFASTSRHLF
jgi:hypothetical protein